MASGSTDTVGPTYRSCCDIRGSQSSPFRCFPNGLVQSGITRGDFHPPREGGNAVTTFVVKSNPRNGPLGEAYRLIINDYQLPNRPLITQVLAEFSESSPPRLSATSAVKQPALEKPSPLGSHTDSGAGPAMRFTPGLSQIRSLFPRRPIRPTAVGVSESKPCPFVGTTFDPIRLHWPEVTRKRTDAYGCFSYDK